MAFAICRWTFKEKKKKSRCKTGDKRSLFIPRIPCQISRERINQPFSRAFFVFFSTICEFESNTLDWLNLPIFLIKMVLNIDSAYPLPTSYLVQMKFSIGNTFCQTIFTFQRINMQFELKKI